MQEMTRPDRCAKYIPSHTSRDFDMHEELARVMMNNQDLHRGERRVERRSLLAGNTNDATRHSRIVRIAMSCGKRTTGIFSFLAQENQSL